MSEDSDEQVSLVEKLSHRLGFAVAAAWEARCAWLLESELPNFVLGAEGASADCGRLLTDQDLPQTNVRDRLVVAEELFGANTPVILLDNKTINPSLCASDRGGLYYYCFERQPKQVQCAAFIVQNPAEPGLGAPIPRHYVDQKCSGSRFNGLETSLTSRPPEPFPTEWSPFVMPVAFLAEALRILAAFVRGTRSTWINPYNGAEFTDCKPPGAASLALLWPEKSSHLNDARVLSQIKSAFDAYSDRYQIARTALRPSVGDCIIVHTDTSTKVTVELKRSYAKILQPSQLSHAAGRVSRHGGVQKFVRFFTPITLWDFLLTTIDGGFVLVSRGDLPPDCFDRQDTNSVVWTPAPGRRLRDHTFKGPIGKDFVHAMERVLDHYLATSGLCTTTACSLVRPTLESILDMMDDGMREAEPPPAASAVEAPPLRGSGWRWSPRAFRTRQEDWIAEQCARCNFGAVYRLDGHPSASHAFSPWQADNFATLELDAPMIYLNFAPINHFHQLVPNDGRRPNTLLYATHGKSPSLFLMNSVPENLDHLSHHYYLVPSTTIKTKKRIEISNEHLKNPGKAPSFGRLFLSKNELIDVYAVAETDVIAELRRLFAQPLHVQHLQMGNLIAEYTSVLSTGIFWASRLDDEELDDEEVEDEEVDDEEVDDDESPVEEVDDQESSIDKAA